MNIREVKKLVAGASYENELEVLETIYEYAGDDVMNGYLGSSVSTISYDENGKVEFESNYLNGELMTSSIGAILDNSVLIRQVQECGDKDFCQLISWKKDGSSYTYLVFDNEVNMQDAYSKLKKSSGDFLEESINQLFEELGISFDSIMNIKIDQKVEQRSISVNELLDDYDESVVSESLEVSRSVA